MAGSFVLSVGKKKEELLAYKNDALAYGLWIMIPFLGFSAVSNKLLWYLYPVTIPLFLCTAAILGSIMKSEKLLPFFRILAATLAVLCIFIYAKDVYMTVKTQTETEGNDFQNLVKVSAGAVRKQYGDDAVIYAGVIYGMNEDGTENDDWAGQDVFVAEAYGDLRCLQGGRSFADRFAKKSETEGVGLLFLSREYEAEWLASDGAKSGNKLDESAEYVVYLLGGH